MALLSSAQAKPSPGLCSVWTVPEDTGPAEVLVVQFTSHCNSTEAEAAGSWGSLQASAPWPEDFRGRCLRHRQIVPCLPGFLRGLLLACVTQKGPPGPASGSGVREGERAPPS